MSRRRSNMRIRVVRGPIRRRLMIICHFVGGVEMAYCGQALIDLSMKYDVHFSEYRRLVRAVHSNTSTEGTTA